MSNKRIQIAILIVISITIYGFNSNNSLIIIPAGWGKPNYNFTKNPLNKETIALGRKMFYDPILSRDSTISCSSCHLSYTAFTHVDHDLSHGINGKIGTRNAPALMNLAWSKSFMWDGAINHLDMQALAPISHPAEMGNDIKNIIAQLQHSSSYPKLFKTAFGDSVISGVRILKAIAQFELTLISANSKYDQVMRKVSGVSFSIQELNGLHIFRKNCESCHREPLFTNNEFANNGLPVDTFLKDIGRMTITQNPQDSLCFKVPTLRNIEYSFPYMHDGRFKKLSDVLKHYTSGIQQSSTLSKQLQQPIILSSDERVDLIAFLLTLTDKSFLYNPIFAYPKNNFQ